jgi:drug/metabolite transporter (DMT)-like permease
MAAPMGAPMVGVPSSMGPIAATSAEITGVSRIKWGALLGVLGLVLAFAGVLIVVLDVGLGISSVSASGYVSILNTILAAVLIIVAGVFLALLSFVLYTAGFASLRKADRRFSTPMVLCLIGLIGLLLIGLFVVFYATAIHAAIACPGTDTTCQNNATSLSPSVVPLAYLGAILGFIGLIGAILGLYRFGARYASTVTKVGAILYIIPVLAIIAPVLVLIGAHQIQRRLERPPMAPPAFSAPPPPM